MSVSSASSKGGWTLSNYELLRHFSGVCQVSLSKRLLTEIHHLQVLVIPARILKSNSNDSEFMKKI